MKYIILLFSLVVWLGLSSGVHAQETQQTKISVSPAIIEVIAEPGADQTRTITIRNGGNSSLPISLEMQSLVSYDGFFDSDVALSNASEWVEISDDVVVLAPNEARTIELNFDIPDNATSGGHYAQLNVRALTLQTDSDNQKSIVVPEIAVTILVTVPGDLRESYEFVSDNYFPLFNIANNSQKLEFTIKNTGNTHGIVTPVLVLSKNDEEVYRKQLRSQLILPATSKEYTETWEVPNEQGRYSARLEFSVGGNQEDNVLSENEQMFITSSMLKIFLIGTVTFSLIYILRNHRNIKKAYKVLRHEKKD